MPLGAYFGLIYRFVNNIESVNFFFLKEGESEILNTKFITSLVIKLASLLIPASIFLLFHFFLLPYIGEVAIMLFGFGLPTFMIGFLLFSGFEVNIMLKLYSNEVMEEDLEM